MEFTELAEKHDLMICVPSSKIKKENRTYGLRPWRLIQKPGRLYIHNQFNNAVTVTYIQVLTVILIISYW